MEKITIFTDGSSRGNPGPGGWGAILVISDNKDNDKFPTTNVKVKELGGGDKKTTNNRMELKASIEALRCVESLKLKADSLTLYTDSSYVVNGITKWAYSWERRNWVTVNKEPVLNKDLWEDLLSLVKGKKIEWKRIEGHVGVKGNERADMIATAFADGTPFNLYEGPLSHYEIKDILNISSDAGLKQAKNATKKKTGGKAYSYVSLVGKKIEIHKTWAECEARVKGVKAKFRKITSPDEEKALIAEWSK
ncbi:MAG: hypothetical protein RJA61_65 [Candidatus Parcubacteria bacterium]|jgi:ribonuclease HI